MLRESGQGFSAQPRKGAERAFCLLIGPSDVVCLREGQRTVWTVAESLRKVYIA